MKETQNIIEYRKQYYQKNKEKMIAQTKAAASKNKEFIRGYQKAYAKLSKRIKKLEEQIKELSGKERTFRLVSPEGKLIVVKGLSRFCRENDLNMSSMRAVIHSKQIHHKGWRKYFEGQKLTPHIEEPKIDRETYLKQYYRDNRAAYIARAMERHEKKKAEINASK